MLDSPLRLTQDRQASAATASATLTTPAHHKTPQTANSLNGEVLGRSSVTVASILSSAVLDNFVPIPSAASLHIARSSSYFALSGSGSQPFSNSPTISLQLLRELTVFSFGTLETKYGTWPHGVWLYSTPLAAPPKPKTTRNRR